MSDSEDRMKTAVGNIKQARNLLGDANSALNDVQGEMSKLRRENKRLVEPQLPEGAEWPRFEDGELVGIGDEVEYGDKAWEVDAICFDREEWSMALSRNLDFSRMSGSYGERVKRPAPKVLDADGVEIKVGDTVYCDGEDEALTVTSISGVGVEYCCVTVKNADSSHCTVDAPRLSHERPDSWERLEQDARGGATGYARDVLGVNVLTTPTSENREVFARDIVRRAKALAKKEEA